MDEVEISVSNVADLQDEETPPPHIDAPGPLNEIVTGGERDSLVRVQLGNGTVHRINRSDPNFAVWHPFLVERLSTEAPVYVESGKDSRLIRRLLAPSLNYVDAIKETPVDGRLEVVLVLTPSATYLRLDHPLFHTFLDLLKNAANNHTALLITIEPRKREIVDVREKAEHHQLNVPNGLVPFDAVDAPPPPDGLGLETLTAISMSRAIEEFEFLKTQAQIPFDYPWDCCTARAHEMCRIFIEHGLNPRKIFNYGSGFEAKKFTLRFNTTLDDDGFILWRYHVAPLLDVFVDGSSAPLVFDPSMFSGPVLIEEWVALQNDGNATQREIDDDVAFLFPNGTRIFTTFAENDQKLRDHRDNRNLMNSHH